MERSTGKYVKHDTQARGHVLPRMLYMFSTESADLLSSGYYVDLSITATNSFTDQRSDTALGFNLSRAGRDEAEAR